MTNPGLCVIIITEINGKRKLKMYDKKEIALKILFWVVVVAALSIGTYFLFRYGQTHPSNPSSNSGAAFAILYNTPIKRF